MLLTPTATVQLYTIVLLHRHRRPVVVRSLLFFLTLIGSKKARLIKSKNSKQQLQFFLIRAIYTRFSARGNSAEIARKLEQINWMEVSNLLT